ncbi:MAG: hypothetical protein M3Q79_03000 [bacterium]|nr:hypothetical protein [bacterium]
MIRKKYTYKYSRRKALTVLNRNFISKDQSNEADFIRTREFINNSFNEYESTNMLEKVDYAFMIPTRASRTDLEYWEEVYEFLPALKHMKPEEAFKVLSSLPPFRIEMYGKQGEGSKGVLIFTPIFNDMLQDFKNKWLLLRFARKRANDAANFAHERFGVKFIGLGATIPKITNYGKAIKAPVITTTGHAGTAYLLEATVIKVFEELYSGVTQLSLGFIGGGAIGSASMQLIAKRYPHAKFYIHDKRKSVNLKNYKLLSQNGFNVQVSDSNKVLVESCDVIVSAITTKISVDGWDLTNKAIIDDSQPGSFKKVEVDNAGGKLIWVVGHDYSKTRFATRRSGYSFGPHGLNSESDLWGCEAEVASIAEVNNPGLAVSGPVSSQQVEDIGEIFTKLGIGVANYQSHGELLTLD